MTSENVNFQQVHMLLTSFHKETTEAQRDLSDLLKVTELKSGGGKLLFSIALFLFSLTKIKP